MAISDYGPWVQPVSATWDPEKIKNEAYGAAGGPGYLNSEKNTTGTEMSTTVTPTGTSGQAKNAAAAGSAAKPAYTYDDFVSAATKAGVIGSFDSNDLDYAMKYPEYGLSMVSLMRDLGNAKTNEQRLLATEAMNQLRKDYGSYWTGEPGNRSYATSYGSQIGDTMKKIGNYGDYNSAYGKQIDQALKDVGSYKDYSSAYKDDISKLMGNVKNYGDYKSAYGSDIDRLLGNVKNYGEFKYTGQDDYKKLLDSVVNRKEFSYDPEADELFSSYRKAYLREGDRAAANALAQAASATGGKVSSYAQQAAQQAGNYYAGQLADMIPQLRAQSLSEYNNRTAQLMDALGLLNTDRANEYQVWGDRYAQLKDQLGVLQGQDATAYGRYLDTYNRLRDQLGVLQGQDATDYARYLDAYGRLQQNLQNLQGQDTTAYGRWQDTYNRLNNYLGVLQGQDESDYKRYLDMVNAEYQRDRDAVTDAQQELQNSLTIYQLTGNVTGPLKDLLAAAGVGGDTGGSGGGGGYTGGVLTKVVTDTAENPGSNKVTVPTYDSRGNVTTTVVPMENKFTATSQYLAEAQRRGDITAEQRSLMQRELTKPGSTGGQAELVAIQNDFQKGYISPTEAQQRLQNLSGAKGTSQAVKTAAATIQKVAAERAAGEAAAREKLNAQTQAAATGGGDGWVPTATGKGGGSTQTAQQQAQSSREAAVQAAAPSNAATVTPKAGSDAAGFAAWRAANR